MQNVNGLNNSRSKNNYSVKTNQQTGVFRTARGYWAVKVKDSSNKIYMLGQYVSKDEAISEYKKYQANFRKKEIKTVKENEHRK